MVEIPPIKMVMTWGWFMTFSLADDFSVDSPCLLDFPWQISIAKKTYHSNSRAMSVLKILDPPSNVIPWKIPYQ
jgi:hypothetical protein